MRIVRYRDGDGAAYGVLEDEAVYALQGDVFGACNAGSRLASLEDVQILAPCLPVQDSRSWAQLR